MFTSLIDTLSKFKLLYKKLISILMIISQHLNNNIFFRNKDSTSSPSPKKFGIFPNRQQDKADKENGNTMTLSRVGQRYAVLYCKDKYV